MSIEEEIFKKSIIDYSKLIDYGFIKKNNYYLYSKYIINNTFKIIINISSKGIIKGQIYDLAYNDEYLNYRIKNPKSQFTNKLLIEFINLLNDIKDKCTTPKYFISNQANRISSLIITKYKVYPEFLWLKYPEYCVFRNPNTKKWFCIIMNINKNKLMNGEGQIEIINVKVAENKIPTLLTKKNFFKAYHMNKNKWLSIILDNTIKDQEIMCYVNESYQFSIHK